MTQLDVWDCRSQCDAESGPHPEPRFRASAKNDIPDANTPAKHSFSDKNSTRSKNYFLTVNLVLIHTKTSFYIQNFVSNDDILNIWCLTSIGRFELHAISPSAGWARNIRCYNANNNKPKQHQHHNDARIAFCPNLIFPLTSSRWSDMFWRFSRLQTRSYAFKTAFFFFL